MEEKMTFVFQGIEKEALPKQDEFVFQGIEEKPVSAKAKKIAEGFKLFGKEPFTPEQVEVGRRRAGIGLKRLAGGLLGTPGDITQLLKGAVRVGASGLIGEVEPVKKVGKILGKGIDIIPTSGQIEKFFEKTTGEKFDAETFGEKIIGNTAGYLGSILTLGGPLKGTVKIPGALRTALAAFVPATAVAAAEKAGAPPWLEASAAIGSSLLLHKMTGKSLKDIKKGWYKEAESLAEGKSISAIPLKRNLDKLKKTAAKGIKTGPKSAVNEMISEIENKISGPRISGKDIEKRIIGRRFGVKDIDKKIIGNRIEIPELLEIKRNINERMGEFEKIKGSKGLFKALAKTVDDGIKQYETIHPKFREAYRSANSLHKGMNESRTIERWIKKHPIVAAEAGIVLNILPGGLVTKVGLVKGGEIAAAMIRNPGLRKAHMEVLKNASRNEIKGTIQSLRRFNKIAKEEGLE